MDEKPKRACPACKSDNYKFRHRKTIESEAAKPAAVETKFRCEDCKHEWKERVSK